MEKLTKSEIYVEVRALLDELGDNDAGFMLSDKDSSELNTIIDKVTPLSVRNIHISAPYRMLDGETYTLKAGETDTHENGETDTHEISDFSIENKKATMTLPTGFLRLVQVKLSSWNAPVVNVITEDMPEYRMQANEYMRGTHYKPVCAFVLLANGLQGLELFSAKDEEDTLSSLIILKEPKWVEEGESVSISICPRLRNSIIAQITGQTLLALGEEQRAQTFLSLSNNYSQ